MSQDFEVVCDTCKTYRHLGQDMACQPSFGYGSNDEVGRSAAMRFVIRHLYYEDRESFDNKHGENSDGTPKGHCGAKSLRIVLSDNVPLDYAEEIDEVAGRTEG